MARKNFQNIQGEDINNIIRVPDSSTAESQMFLDLPSDVT